MNSVDEEQMAEIDRRLRHVIGNAFTDARYLYRLARSLQAELRDLHRSINRQREQVAAGCTVSADWVLHYFDDELPSGSLPDGEQQT